MKLIRLTNKKDLDTYMDPQRQRILREMHLAGEPMTPKELSVRLGISPSSVQHHIKRLVDLGVVELHHTAQINGITARYYRPALVTVSFGLHARDDMADPDKALIIESMVSGVLQNYLKAITDHPIPPETVPDIGYAGRVGDVASGVVYLTPEESRELVGIVHRYLMDHARKEPGQQAWEYALVAYNTEAE